MNTGKNSTLETIKRKKCIMCEGELVHMLTVHKFPIHMGITEDPSEKDVHADMIFLHCNQCDCTQLGELIPLEILYSEEHGSGTIGALWMEHHKAFAKFILGHRVRSVLEVGGLHGILATKALAKDKKLKWTIVEPNPRIEGPESSRIKVIRGWFDDNFCPSEDFDTIVHSHVLEHLYDPHSFIENKKNICSPGMITCFSIPNMKIMLKNKYANVMNFEHTYCLTEEIVDTLLGAHGFEVIRKEKFKEDHSIFYSAIRTNEVLNKSKETTNFTNRKIFEEFIIYHIKDIALLNKKIEEHAGDVYLFGGHIFSQFLINWGLNTNKIIAILDNDPNKQGKRMYGTELIVKSPRILKDTKKAMLILRAGVYNKEIKKDIIENINSTTVII